jgi:hypothetical protein
MLHSVNTLFYYKFILCLIQDSFVLQQGLRALFGLTLASDTANDSNDINSSDAAMTVLAEAGACEVVVACLQSFHKDSDVAAWSCRTCFALAGRCSITRARLASAGICKAIVKVMSEHCKDREVTEEGCAAIHSLSADAETRVYLQVCWPFYTICVCCLLYISYDITTSDIKSASTAVTTACKLL